MKHTPHTDTIGFMYETFEFDSPDFGRIILFFLNQNADNGRKFLTIL